MHDEEELKTKLVVGAKIRLGPQYCEAIDGNPGDVITLALGTFEEDDGLTSYITECPAVWNELNADFDSIYHLFGNYLEWWYDCRFV